MPNRKKLLPKEEKEFLEEKINEVKLLHLIKPDTDLIREFETLSKQGYADLNEYKNKYYSMLSQNIGFNYKIKKSG